MNKVFSILATCCLFALATTAQAQLPAMTMHATIPFDFSVRGKTLPAGEYEIKRIDGDAGGLIIDNVHDNHDRAIFETETVIPKTLPTRGEIVFHRYGDNYYLFEIFPGGDLSGRELLPSRAERVMRREMASNRAQIQTVALVTY